MSAPQNVPPVDAAAVGGVLLAELAGVALPASAEGLAAARGIVDDYGGGGSSVVEEICGEDLVDYVVQFQEQGRSIEDAVDAWANHWGVG